MANIPLPSVICQVKRVVGADPAANNEFSITVPAGKSWLLMAVFVKLVQGATQTPQPILQIADAATNILMESIGSSAAQAVSTTCAYTWGPGFVQSGQVGATVNVHSVAPVPDGILLLSGWIIQSSTLGIGANSDYGVPSALVAELG